LAGRKLLNQALSIWAPDAEAHQPEIARSTFLKSKTLYLQHPGDDVQKRRERAAL
jgi:hypothetical protein